MIAAASASRGWYGLLVGVLVCTVAVACDGHPEDQDRGTERASVGPVSLTVPQVVAGLRRSGDAGLQRVADSLAAQLKAETSSTSTVAAVYEDPADANRLVAIIGGTIQLSDPDAELGNALVAAAGGEPLLDLRTVDPGPLRGVARCGHTTESDVPVALCGWADDGSLAIAFFFRRELDESARLLLALCWAMTHP